jgi:hypothetical protein
MEELAYRATLALAVIIVVTFIIFYIAARYWGWGILGSLVKPRPVLIYEGRSWWAKRAALYFFIASSLTGGAEFTFWILAPEGLSEIWTSLVPIWIIMLIGIFLEYMDRPQGINQC